MSLASLAAERISYDFIEFNEIRFGGRILTSDQKKTLYRIPYSEILDFLLDIEMIDKDIKDNLFKINMTRNKYIHPIMGGEPKNDALSTLNLLCKTIDLIINSRKDGMA